MISNEKWNGIRRALIVALRDTAIETLTRECACRGGSDFGNDVAGGDDGLQNVVYDDASQPTETELDNGLDDSISNFIETYVDIITDAATTAIRNATDISLKLLAICNNDA